MEIVPIESAYPGFGELVVSVIFTHQQISYMVKLLPVYHLVPEI